MKQNKKNFIISGILIFLSVLFTILVKVVDIKNVGANNTAIGFSTINKFISDKIGVNMVWYDISTYLGLMIILVALVYALIGLIQLVKRKSLFKVDNKIIALGGYYVVVMGLYVFFEKVIINYRPILIDNQLEASYPSSHTLMTICLCGSSIIMNKLLFKEKFYKKYNCVLLVIGIMTIVGRFLSGAHWATDILGGLLISSALLTTFSSVLNILPKAKKN